MNKKKYIIRAIKKAQKISDTREALYRLGVDLSEYDNGIDDLVMMVAVCIASKNKHVGKIKDDIFWWMYDGPPKVITLKDKSIVDVQKLDSFVNWLFDWYGEKTK